MTAATPRDPDSRNQLGTGTLPAEIEQWCAAPGLERYGAQPGPIVFAALATIPAQDTPILICSTIPLAELAAEAFPAAQRLLRGNTVQRNKRTAAPGAAGGEVAAAALAHGVAPSGK